jgi:hypothetical protein
MEMHKSEVMAEIDDGFGNVSTLWCKLWQLQEPENQPKKSGEPTHNMIREISHVSQKTSGNAKACGCASNAAAG